MWFLIQHKNKIPLSFISLAQYENRILFNYQNNKSTLTACNELRIIKAHCTHLVDWGTDPVSFVKYFDLMGFLTTVDIFSYPLYNPSTTDWGKSKTKCTNFIEFSPWQLNHLWVGHHRYTTVGVVCYMNQTSPRRNRKLICNLIIHLSHWCIHVV